MEGAVRQLHVVQFRQRRLALVQQVGHATAAQTVFDGIEAGGAFGMPLAHLVLPAIAVREIPGFIHFAKPVVLDIG